MSRYIDRSKGKEHVLRELRRIREDVGFDHMDLAERCELRILEMEEEKKQKQHNSSYYTKYFDQLRKTRQLEQELNEMKQQAAFNEAVEKAVAERMGGAEKTEETEPPAETETTAETA